MSIRNKIDENASKSNKKIIHFQIHLAAFQIQVIVIIIIKKKIKIKKKKWTKSKNQNIKVKKIMKKF